jgi:poly(glycerol-phosphate) alpha-glucosyltransferase
VSILHNSHKTAPYIGDAPTKPNWVPFFEDLRNVHVMVCLTERQRADLSARYPGLPLKVVHHAVPSPRRFRQARKHDRLVFVGRLAEQKRVEQLIEAFALVAASVPRARLDIYGSGALREELEAQLQAAGLGSRVRFLGHTGRPDTAFASAAAAVMSSWYEGLPLALTEAMAVGTPFISYDLDYGPAEVIRDGVDGWLVPFGDVEALAARMAAVLRDRATTERVSAAAREVGRRFSAERYREEWLSVLRAAGRPLAAAPPTEAPLARTHS